MDKRADATVTPDDPPHIRQGVVPALLLGTCLLLALAIVVLTAVAVERWIDARRQAHADARVATAPPPVATGPAPARARSDEANWLTSDDYPPESIRREEEGTVSITWTIDTDGRARHCRVSRSSGVPRLDAAACGAIERRGRYFPARDAQGRPVATEKTRRVAWRLPDG